MAMFHLEPHATGRVVTVWRRVAKLLRGLRCTFYKKMLRELDLLSCKGKSGVIVIVNCLTGTAREGGTRLLRSEQKNPKGSGQGLQQKKYIWETREKLFTTKAAKHLH